MLAWMAFGDLWALNHKVDFDGPNEIIRVPDDVVALDVSTDIYAAWLQWKALYENSQYDSAIRKVLDFYFLQNGWTYNAGQLHIMNQTGYLLSGEVIAAVKGETGLAAWNVEPGSAPEF